MVDYAQAEIAIDAQSNFIKQLQAQITDLTSGGPSGLWEDDVSSGGSPRRLAKRVSSAVEPEDASVDGAGAVPRGSAASRRDSAPSIAEVNAVNHLLEISNLKEELMLLKKQRELDVEELALRQEEIQNLSSVLRAKEEECDKLKTSYVKALAAQRDEVTTEVHAAALKTLHAYNCQLCRSKPFSDVVDIAGVTVIHEQTCFDLQQTHASLQRVEERAAVLQSEVDDLKLMISENRMKNNKLTSPAHVEREARTPATPEYTASSAPVDWSEYTSRPIVDVQVVQDLQAKLSSLIHVHRQLLRKYAVVDVECGELAEAVKVGRLSRFPAAFGTSLIAILCRDEICVLES